MLKVPQLPGYPCQGVCSSEECPGRFPILTKACAVFAASPALCRIASRTSDREKNQKISRQKERDRAAKEVQRLDAAIAAINGDSYGNVLVGNF